MRRGLKGIKSGLRQSDGVSPKLLRGDNPAMRINLVTPFAEKDAVKALGARWDAAKKLWYITDVADLSPFMRWIPNLEAASEPTDGAAKPAAKTSPGVTPSPRL